MNSSKEQEYHTRLLTSLLDAKKLKREYVDGAQSEYHVRRNQLFQISGIRGKYPQLFATSDDSSDIVFLGCYDKIQEMNELSDVPIELLEKNSLVTFDMMCKGKLMRFYLVLL